MQIVVLIAKVSKSTIYMASMNLRFSCAASINSFVISGFGLCFVLLFVLLFSVKMLVYNSK